MRYGSYNEVTDINRFTSMQLAKTYKLSYYICITKEVQLAYCYALSIYVCNQSNNKTEISTSFVKNQF